MQKETDIRGGKLKIFYERFTAPPGSTGDPIVLIAGLGVQAIEAWEDGFCRKLALSGHDVIRFDNRDSRVANESPDSGNNSPDSGYTISDMAEYLKHFLNKTLGSGTKIHLVGISMGGMIAQQFTIDHRDRVNTLTSISSSVECKMPEFSIMHELLELFLSPKPDTQAEFVDARVKLIQTLNKSDKHKVTKSMIRPIAEAAWKREPTATGTRRQFEAIERSGTREAALKNLPVDTLVIHGEVDPMIPFPAGQQTVDAIGMKATPHWIDEMGHFLHPDFWDKVIKAISSHVG